MIRTFPATHARIRAWVADHLIGIAYRLDPSRPAVRESPNGGFTISVGSINLARITPGMVQDFCPTTTPPRYLEDDA